MQLREGGRERYRYRVLLGFGRQLGKRGGVCGRGDFRWVDSEGERSRGDVFLKFGWLVEMSRKEANNLTYASSFEVTHSP